MLRRLSGINPVLVLSTIIMKRSGNQSFVGTHLLQFVMLVMAVAALYGNFLSSPLVFDDIDFLKDRRPEYLQVIFEFSRRWLPYATIEWTRELLGEDMLWLRLGNLALHILNTLLLFLFLNRLFESVLAEETSTLNIPSGSGRLSLSWLAFSGAMLFALHPAAVYGVAYLIQRTILMATLFTLSSWILFLEGLIRNQRRWLLASAFAYLLAVLAKEHAVMLPAVALALLILVRKPNKQLFAQVGPIFVLCGATAVFIMFQSQSHVVIGNVYEPNAVSMLLMKNIDPWNSYPLSALTQCYLYFKYLLLWVVPNPAWMSVDMLERFAPSLGAWPEIAGLTAFVLYPVVAVRLLWQRGRKGLLGFALLSPWLLFVTELSTVRVQEIFVIYRSYLWMPCIFAALPFLFQKLTARRSVIILAATILALIPASWNRLTSFSDPLLLWDDALLLAQDKNDAPRLGRMFHNRGVAYANKQRYEDAIRDFTEGIKLLPTHSLIYNDRGVAYLLTGRYQEALHDYKVAILLDPKYYNPYLGRAKVYEALGNQEAARLDYARSCKLGVQEVCSRGVALPISSSLEPDQ